MNLLIVSGLSGAGKSVAMNALEDIGFFCIDNEVDELFTVGLITTFEEASFFITLFNNFLFIICCFRFPLEQRYCVK